MARLADRLAENVEGEFFVDQSCIDCDLCRQIAPLTFGQSRSGLSFVQRQPTGAGERRRAGMALVACPTASIGTARKIELRDAVTQFPEPIEGPVSSCGFASESSYGASSYFVRRAAGNVLVDSPRAASALLGRLASLGGVSTMFLSHRDDVADHEAIHRRFGCSRVLHADDVGRGTSGVEQKIRGSEPVSLGPDLLAIPVPGHTRGSMALLYADTFLFSGDHLWGDDDQHLHASRSVCWYSWEEQKRSIAKLLDFRFEWVLPGHGRRFHASSAKSMRAEIENTIRRLR
jgi:glyoxylase-like metal-dependent hydrolase (beta-lactamase superfamily II)/ferredoxin